MKIARVLGAAVFAGLASCGTAGYYAQALRGQIEIRDTVGDGQEFAFADGAIGKVLEIRCRGKEDQRGGSLDLISAPALAANAQLAQDFDIIDKAPTGESKGDAKRFAYVLRPKRAGVSLPPFPEKVVKELRAELPGYAATYNPLQRPAGKAGLVDIGTKGEVQTQVLQDKAETAGLAFANKLDPAPQDHRAAINDSFAEFMFGLYKVFKKRFDRPFGTGVNETVDPTVWDRWRNDPAYRPASLKNHPDCPGP